MKYIFFKKIILLISFQQQFNETRIELNKYRIKTRKKEVSYEFVIFIGRKSSERRRQVVIQKRKKSGAKKQRK